MILHQRCNSRGNYNFNAYVYTDTGWVPHFHKNFELIYVMEGELALTVNGRTENMSAGSYALILANQIHSFEPVAHSVIWIAIFAEQFVPHFAGYMEKFEGEASVFLCSESVHSFVQANLIKPATEPSVTMKKSCFYAVCDEFLKRVSVVPKNSRNDELICRILDYIAEHYLEDITLSTLAEEFGYEYHYISRLLNKSYHINFTDLVNEYRVDKAIGLLTGDGGSGESMSISRIAMESGFKSIRNFNYVFKRVTGVSPGKYGSRKIGGR